MILPRDVAAVTDRFLGLIDEAAPGLVQGLYLRGSLGFGEYFPGVSDVDFTAVLAGRPDAGQIEALAAVHAAVHEQYPRPFFSGFHLAAADLAGPPDRCGVLPCMFEGTFYAARGPTHKGNFDVNPVSWHELARHSISVRGPALSQDCVWTDDGALRAYTYGNLSSYWAGETRMLTRHTTWACMPETAAWCVLGVSRLYHLLATGAMTSKSGAGRYALTAFGPRWQTIVTEALRARERPGDPSAYQDDPAARGRDTTEFTAMAVQAGLALGAGPAERP